MSKNHRINQVEPSIKQEDIKSVSEYMSSGGWITEHNVTKKFENLIKDEVKREFAFAVPNGTIALYLALISSGIKKGDRVAVPNLTMIATINAIIWADAIPVIIDTNDSLTMSYEKLRNVKKLKAVIYVPLNGRIQDGLEIQKWCKKNNKILIEDSAHALGTKYSSNYKAGSLGDVSIFSFTPHKIITTGQGGMVLTNNRKISNNLSDLKYFNRRKDKLDWHDGFGLNFKFTDLQAALGIAQFKRLNSHIERKKTLFKKYNELNNPNFQLRNFDIENEIPWFYDLYSKSVKKIKLLESKLMDRNIEARYAYPPLSKQKYLKKYETTNLDTSEKVMNRILWLPSSVDMTLNDQEKIIEVVNGVD